MADDTRRDPVWLDEYRAARERAVLVDESGRGRIAVAGQDRASFLQGLLTNDIAALTPGAGCYAAYLTPQGRLVADMRVFELGDVMLLDVHPGVRERLVRTFEDLVFTEDVQIEDWTDRWGLVGVHGPQAAEIVAGLFQAAAPAADEPAPAAADLRSMPEYGSRRWAFGEQPVIVIRSHEYGLPGFDLLPPRQIAAAVPAALETAGVRPIGPAALEALRVEAGRPAFGVDMDEDTIPLEAGIEGRAISFTKGCYIGQEVIIRVLHRGHGRVARRLVGLALEAPAARGDRILAEEREVGHITSAVYSPARRQPIALGYVHRDFVEPDAAVSVEHDGRRSRAEVTKLPFVESEE